MVFTKERRISKGEELTLLYGEFSDAQLLCNYGICPDMPGRWDRGAFETIGHLHFGTELHKQLQYNISKTY